MRDAEDVDLAALPDDNTAALLLSFDIATTYSDKWIFDVCMVARHGWSQGTQEQMMTLCGNLYEEAAEANDDYPMLGYAMDMHGTHLKVLLRIRWTSARWTCPAEWT